MFSTTIALVSVATLIFVLREAYMFHRFIKDAFHDHDDLY